MVTLANWRERMSEDMRLRDFRPRTQEGYALAVRQLLDRISREPATLTDEELQLLLARRPTADAAEQEDEEPARAPLRCPRRRTPTLRLLRKLSASECVVLILAGVSTAEHAARAPPRSPAAKTASLT